jgi:hypothetical protein
MGNSELPEDKRDMVLRKIYERLSDKSVKKELYDSIKKIEEIYGYPIDIALIITDMDSQLGIDTYNEDSYNYSMDMNYGDMLKKPDDETMKLSEFRKFLSEEDPDLKICIDPIYLKEGINEIGNVLLTTYDNKVIIVPKPVE